MCNIFLFPNSCVACFEAPSVHPYANLLQLEDRQAECFLGLVHICIHHSTCEGKGYLQVVEEPREHYNNVLCAFKWTEQSVKGHNVSQFNSSDDIFIIEPCLIARDKGTYYNDIRILCQTQKLNQRKSRNNKGLEKRWPSSYKQHSQNNWITTSKQNKSFDHCMETFPLQWAKDHCGNSVKKGKKTDWLQTSDKSCDRT